jgi:hypothetical protein
MQPVLIEAPELSEQRWNEWVQKGRTGDAARVRKWRFIAVVVIVIAVGIELYLMLRP